MTSLNVFAPQAPHSVALVATTGPALHMAPDIITWLQICLIIETLTEYQRHANWSHRKGLVEVVGFTWTLNEGRDLSARSDSISNIKMADTLGKKSGKSM